ncbi:DUF1446-domain-containing protein [Paraphaeosphaeria sporulosa]|uniref:DUF1446-domain-containing protein n=1 Tax=Paraphaeosphaeria sporulosa TaxID=1460663 RepID=A0A177CTZ6_9PLEO|nr:DUF1446-domain-containing protein [Paraphaeosphaeria sporulosa]OAG10691.1 DUF1446-domain-containing protein [Paraphaeosphaeria sporulosa]
MKGVAESRDRSRSVLRIGGVSGGVFDRFRSIQDLAKDPSIHAVLFGDWISEISMTFRGNERASRTPDAEQVAFEMSFISALKPAIQDIAKNKQRVAVNAGSCDPEAMAKVVQQLVKDHGTDLKVSWVTGDDVTTQFKEMLKSGEKFPSLPSDTPIDQWGVEPVCAQAYLGGVGIAEALRHGADIVICGRVADAAPVVGAAMWFHNWGREDFTELAHALMAGHLLECSSYVTGGYYTGFKKELLQSRNCTNLGFPIGEIESNGEFVITKEKTAGGIVNVSTVTAQLLYEIQGPLYYNSDVTARLDGIHVADEGPDRVRVTGVVGLPPPPTTKIGITARGGWQAEVHFFLTGLDIAEKVELVKRQTLESMGEYQKEFTTLTFNVTGSVAENPKNQASATVDLRIFAQSKNPDIMSAGSHKGVAPDTPSFAKWVIENCLQGYPGGTPAMDLRQSTGKPFFEYWVALFPQNKINHEMHTFNGMTIPVPAPTVTAMYPRQQVSYDTSSPLPLDSWGPTVRAPLGHIVHGRSGDKSSDCNLGLFVRHADEWDWLRSLLSVGKLRELLEEEDTGKKIDRFEIPSLNAVHFLLRDHLDRGANSSSSYDILGKNVCEYIRYKKVDIPKVFYDRGTI